MELNEPSVVVLNGVKKWKNTLMRIDNVIVEIEKND